MGNLSTDVTFSAPAAGLGREKHQLYALWIWCCPDRHTRESEKALFSPVVLSGTRKKRKLL